MLRLLLTLPSVAVAIRHATLDVFAASNPYNVWIPFELKPGFVQYFNPEENRVVDRLPHGAVAITKKPALVQQARRQEPAAAAPVMAEPTTPVTDEAPPVTTTAPPAVQAPPELAVADDEPAPEPAAVEEQPEEGKACTPYATWHCTELICQQDCVPECKEPVCQTRCQDPDLAGCTLKCDEHPVCSTFCPTQEPCTQTKADGSPDCEMPKCGTHCGTPSCHLECGAHAVNCTSVCADPECNWNCKKPDVCPQPDCKLVYTKEHCDASGIDFDLPDVKPNQHVMNSFHAKDIDYEVGEWGDCDCETGRMYRSVSCPPNLKCGDGHPPATSKKCEDVDCKPVWDVGEWSECKGKCFQDGQQHREVTCVNDFCEGADKPEEFQTCTYNGTFCGACEATLYGGEFFDGWNHTLPAGEYDHNKLQAMEVQITDGSSIDVFGFCCTANLYQHGDFNSAGNGWEVAVKEGRYQQSELVAKRFVDGQLHSVTVQKDEGCIARGASSVLTGVSALVLMAVSTLF